MDFKVMAWNVDMLKTEEKRIEIEAVIRNSKADIFVLSEFPSNEAGLKLLDSLKSMYRYILPTTKTKYKKRFFPIDDEQELKDGYEVPPYTYKGWMITIVLIRKENAMLQGFQINDIDNNKSELMNKEFRWVELEGSLWGEEISIIGVHIPICGEGGENYWNYLESHIRKKDSKVIIIGDMNVSTRKNACRNKFLQLKENSVLFDLALQEENTKITYKEIYKGIYKKTRIDYVLLSQYFFNDNTVITYIHDDSYDDFANSDHVNIGVTIKKK